MNALIATRLQRADDEARAAIAREQLIGMGHTRGEVDCLPDAYVLQLVRMLSVPQPEERARCPVCGEPCRSLGARDGLHWWNCDVPRDVCRMGAFTEAS